MQDVRGKLRLGISESMAAMMRDVVFRRSATAPAPTPAPAPHPAP